MNGERGKKGETKIEKVNMGGIFKRKSREREIDQGCYADQRWEERKRERKGETKTKYENKMRKVSWGKKMAIETK